MAFKERIVWIVATLILIILTYFIARGIRFPQDVSEGSLPTFSSDSDVEREANKWFDAGDPTMPKRDLFDRWKNLDPYLLIYEDEVKQGASWIHYPEQIALHVFYPPAEIEGFVPKKVTIYYHNENIVSVTVITSGLYQMGERRFDFVKEDNIWKIIWVGERSISPQ